MEWLNYHHLLYFWTVAREGGLAPAADKLRLAQPTISAQIHALEDALGEKLFAKQGRRLVMTDMGRLVFGYADEIFSLGRELMDTIKGRPTGRPLRLVVGIAEVVPKLIVRRLLAAMLQESAVRLVCREDKTDRLVAGLAAHQLDVVLADAPLPPGSGVRAFNHLLGECGVTCFGVKSLAMRCRKRFPESLDGVPWLMPSENTALRRGIEHWMGARGIRPEIVAEFDDSALLKVFGQDGMGVFPGPTAIESDIRRQYGVEVIGRIPEVRERFYAISVERRIKHPAVAALCEVAHEQLFKEGRA